jgi:hypothetical protein
LPKVLAETEDFLGLKKCAARRVGFGGFGLWMSIPVLLFGCGYSSAPSSCLGLNTHSLGLFGNYFWQKV